MKRTPRPPKPEGGKKKPVPETPGPKNPIPEIPGKPGRDTPEIPGKPGPDLPYPEGERPEGDRLIFDAAGEDAPSRHRRGGGIPRE